MLIPFLMGTLIASPDKSLPANRIFIKADIGNKTYNLEVADTLEKKGDGLSGRVSLPKNQGMLFTFSNTTFHHFWMKSMNFPLEFIWLEENKVVDLTKNVTLGLESFSGRRKHNKVIELNAGQIKESRIEIGDSVYFHK